MRYLALIAILILFLFALMNGCQNKAEISVSKKTTPTPSAVLPEPDYATIENQVSEFLDRPVMPPLDKQYIRKRIEEVSEKLKNCETDSERETCSKSIQANLHLMLGDLYYSVSAYKNAVDHYQASILSRYESFETDQEQLHKTMKINTEEKERSGDSPRLRAGEAFLEATYALKAFKDYAEMARGERRLAEALEKSQKTKESAEAKKRAELGLKKAMEFRITFEKNKRSLLSLVEKLGPEYQSYRQYIQLWDKDIKIKQI